MIDLAKKIVIEIAKREGYAKTEIHNANNLQDDGIPTVFLGNHNQGHNLTNIIDVTQPFLTQDIHPVIRDNIFKEKKWFIRELSRSFFYHAGAIAIQRRLKGKTKAPIRNNLRTYKKTLQQGENILIMPTGIISIDGTVDYTIDDMAVFSERHIKALDWMMGENLDGSKRVKFQYIYSTSDEVFEKNHVCIGPSFTADNIIPYLEGMIQSTKVITGLQLHYFLKTTKSSAKLYKSAIYLRKKGFIIPSPEFDNGDLELPEKTFARTVRAYARETATKDLKLYDLKSRFGTIIRDDENFQYNQVKHMSDELSNIAGKNGDWLE